MARSTSSGGRPRRSGRDATDPREGIIAAAATLFARRGFSATRMTEIAEESGLRQSSIYYWFRSKDEVLRAIMDQNRVSLTAARALAHRDGPAAVRLYVVLYQDVVQMCSAPLNFYDLEEAANNQPDVFGDFHDDYAELSAELAEIVAQGVASGAFCAVVPEEFVRTALSLTEGSQHRFHGRRDRSTIHEYADPAAWTAVRALVADVDAMAGIRESARAGLDGFRAVAGTEMQPTGG